MDNEEEIQGVKFSEFPSATPESADEIVGLHSEDNARFSLANIILLVRQGLANIFVPNTRKVNNKALSSDITLDASDVGARPISWTPSASDVGAVPSTSVGSAGGVASLGGDGKVPTSQLPPISAEGKADETTIAPVEASTTASEAHALGSIFYLNGVLYRALADIAIGGTINTASGGNATQTTIAANFSRIVKLTSAQYAQLSAAEKAADIVYIITDDPVPEISTSTPQMDGMGAAGSTGEVSDAGHVHPSDTSKANETELAYVESGSTASRAYAIGEYFCWNGLLYRAKTAISSGASFTVGTNCVATTSCIFETNAWTPTNANAISTYNFYTIAGNICIINICLRLTSNLSGKSEVVVLSDVATAIGRTPIPSDRLISANCIARNSGTVSIFCRCFIYDNKLSIVNESQTTIHTSDTATIMGQLIFGIGA